MKVEKAQAKRQEAELEITKFITKRLDKLQKETGLDPYNVELLTVDTTAVGDKHEHYAVAGFTIYTR